MSTKNRNNGYDGFDEYEEYVEYEDYEEVAPTPKKKKSGTGKSSSGKTGSNKTGTGTGKKKKKLSKKQQAAKKRNRIILFAAEIIILCVLGIVLWWVTKGTQAEKVNLNQETLVSDEVEEKINSTVVVAEDGTETTVGDLYTQIVLFGVDARNGALSINTRTDTIIIASINNQTHEVKLCSVFRDTYLNLSNDEYNKCNSAYAFGGPQQAIQMLNMNLDLNIRNYVTVGFKGVVETVDALGGITLDLTDAEIPHLNSYQYCIAEDLGRTNDYIAISSAGSQLVNGLQACGYCRIRYTAGDDFKRTERQRTVLTLMLEKAKGVNASTLSTIASNSFQNVSTSFDLNDILEYASNITQYNIVGSEGFPFADYRVCGTIGPKGSCVVPTDLTTNVSLLHEYLFGISDYDPTDTVKTCSEKIAADTSPYL